MARRCTVLDDYQGVALSTADWSGLAGDVEVTVLREHIADPDELVAALADSEIVVSMRERTPFPAELFAALPKLELLVTTAMRNASIDLAAAAEHGVTVCGTGYIGTPTVELTWALILGLARNVAVENAGFHAGDGRWQTTVGADLAGATLGLLGLGRLGTGVAKVAQAFGMNVTAWSQNLTAERAAEAGVALAPSKLDLIAGADIVSIHLVLSRRTRHLVDAEALAALKPTAYLVNTSRAGIVDTAALVAALRAGSFAGAGLDVYDTEPLPAGDELRTLPNVLGTPHLGYVTRNTYRIFYRDIVEDIAAFLAGSPIRQLG
jgi:phosphoglycerate dehydrogenase-like enzyme